MRLFFQYYELELNKMIRGKIEVKTIQGQKWWDDHQVAPIWNFRGGWALKLG